MKFRRLILILMVLAVACILPVAGVTTYLGGSPQMSAAIAGTNEFIAGDDTTINVIVQNSGTSTSKSVDYACVYGGSANVCNYTGSIQRDDIPTTAKMVTVGLSAGNAPIVVKSDPQMLNADVPTQGIITVPILVKILANASVGEYQVPLTISYTYLASSNQPATESLVSNYQQVSTTVPLTIRIKPQVKIQVLEAIPEDLNVGTGGYLDLKIRNIGSEDGKKATVKIIRSGASPIIPTDSSVFIGDFPTGGNVSTRYKVSVSADASAQTYPVDIAVTYENNEGDVVTSITETVGVAVGGKISFAVVSDPAQLYPGTDNVVVVTYRNTGDATAYHATARLTAVAPFTSSDDSAYLGDIKAGDTVTASYKLTSADTAAEKNYTLDTQVRYRDALDNSQVSDTFRVPVTVVPKPASSGLSTVLPALIIIIVLAAGAGYYLLVIRKKK